LRPDRGVRIAKKETTNKHRGRENKREMKTRFYLRVVNDQKGGENTAAKVQKKKNGNKEIHGRQKK